MSGIDDELRRIAGRHRGVLHAAHVVAFARNKKTALHSQFQWDDDEAAQQFRLMQARKLIRVTVIVAKQTGQTVNAYVSLQKDREAKGGYRYIVDVMSKTKLREQFLAQALRELNALAVKYGELEELAKVFAAIDDAS